MKKISLILISALCATAALAAGDQLAPRTISFDELKVACQNPSRYHNQAAPANIQIGCKDIQLKWVPDTGANFSVTTARQVTTLAFSDKYSVDAMTAVLDTPSQNLACPRFKQIAEKLETVRSVTCNELIAFKGSGTDFCADTLNAVKSANQSAVTLVDTGKMVDLCADAKTIEQQK